MFYSADIARNRHKMTSMISSCPTKTTISAQRLYSESPRLLCAALMARRTSRLRPHGAYRHAEVTSASSLSRADKQYQG